MSDDLKEVTPTPTKQVGAIVSREVAVPAGDVAASFLIAEEDWTPGDQSMTVRLEISRDEGATWETVLTATGINPKTDGPPEYAYWMSWDDEDGKPHSGFPFPVLERLVCEVEKEITFTIVSKVE